MKLKLNEKRKNVEKEPAYISKEGIVLILEVDGLEVRVKTNEGVEVGFAKVILIPMDTGEKLCQISHFEPYVQSIGVDSMMLSGIKLIAENNNANEIYVFPNSADIRIKEEKVSPADVYKRYQNQGFGFDDENADMTAENNKMVLNIII